MRPFSALPTSFLVLLAISTCPTHARSNEDGLKIEITTPAHCSRPSHSGDRISVHYRGTLESDGTEFDASYNRGRPFTFTLGAGQVIRGWDEGLKDMCPGEARRLIIPSDMAYGDRGSPPVIPGGATLVFETLLVDIVGVEQETISFGETATPTEGGFSIATAPSEPPPGFNKASEEDDTSTPALEATPLTSSPSSPMTVQEGECHLLGPFALFVQGALGAFALLTLVYKRWREESKRPWKIWFFDVSKQVIGSMLTHVLNLAMSMLGSVELVNAAMNAAAKASATAVEAAKNNGGGGRTTPNPCSFYILNLAIDTTLGIPILYLLLKLLHAAFSYTALARPKESIKSGHYGQPPRTTWWLKQSLIYFIGLTGMKAFVWFLFALFPWLPWVGDWALRWTEGNEALQVAFAMFVFPLAMNGVQYWIIDNFIMDKTRGKEGQGDGPDYERVRQSDETEGLVGAQQEDDDETVTAESVRGKDPDDEGLPPLKEVHPAPIHEYDDNGSKGEGSRRPSPPG